MEYRIHKRTGDKISVIGLGTSYISDTPQKEAVAALVCAHENGIKLRGPGNGGSQHLRLLWGSVFLLPERDDLSGAFRSQL